MKVMRVDDKSTQPQVGIVTTVDKVRYQARVHIPLLGKETGFIKIATFYAGQGWGFVSLPKVGQEVIVLFANGDLNDGSIIGYYYSEDADTPPYADGCPALAHESGSIFEFRDNGDIVIKAAGNLILQGKKILLN